MFHFYFEDRGLQIIHSCIRTGELMFVFCCSSVVRKHFYFFKKFFVVRNGCSRIPESSHVFAWVETERRHFCVAADGFFLVFRKMRLGSILNNCNFLISHYFYYSIMICRLTVKIDNYDSFRSICQSFSDLVRVYQRRTVVTVGEYRFRTAVHYGFSGRYECMRRTYNFVSGTNI